MNKGDSGTFGSQKTMDAIYRNRKVQAYHATKGKAPFTAPKQTLKSRVKKAIGY